MKEEKPLYNIDDEESDEKPVSIYDIDSETEDRSDIEDNRRSRVIGEDDLPYAYGHLSDEEDSKEESDKVNSPNTLPANPWILLFKIMFSPMSGWRDLKRSKISVEKLGGEMFYPLCGISAASQFIRLIYEANLSVESIIIQGLIVFTSLFLSYFIIPVLARPLLSGKAKEMISEPFGKKTVMILLSTIAIFDILPIALPIFAPVFFFLPLWTIYLISRLPKFFGASKEKSAMIITVLSLLIVGMPILWNIIMEFLLTGSSTFVF